MADETNLTETAAAEATAVVETEPTVKKRRGPHRAKTGTDAAVGETSGKVVKERKKRVPKAAKVADAVSDGPAAVAGKRRRRMAKPAEPIVETAPASASDEIAELMKLEEENKRLRQALAEKLRAENADLRKRLGLA